MNLILLFKEDYIEPGVVRLGGRRMTHIKKVHRAGVGDMLTVGMINGDMGSARVLETAPGYVDMAVILDTPSPAPLPLTLVLALPRPKMLRRILQTVASLGVKEIYLINTWRVEKSFWSSALLEPDRLENELVLGLEQSRDTVMPKVHLRRLFKPFVTRELPEIIQGKMAFTAHPGPWDVCPRSVSKPCVLAMGPEGGFIEREVATFLDIGFKTVSLGERILRLETAVPYIISRLY
ncbi:RNA methyltransferase, RsmE family [Desulfocicer vacuolatum DSM 3385]|uniref:Ribosomal RNA small subunit methyltransferase E n=1 Tax=Desulfocicer vacuolatum DSM 3385 TaxID=1121400 RepID=A0A1W1YZY1_9BACT|nr:16S rRNA (uracil(1498)-N(3))-methyltransferase [Desulfocicer vacuolatum]SMC41683.1 RNA methyltransferase, RsmE family [Desulfocicer vacuolatum DSM 3385]